MTTLNPSTLPSPSPAPDPEPPRKRPRSEVSSEERKEARAHRNRIAAQNSRDRRKAQFSFLERRVNELEEENRQLRISIGLFSQGQPPPTVSPPVPVSSKSPEDMARDRENVELKERIRTLERGWDAVVKALAAQGLPTGLTTAPPPNPPTAAFPSPAPSHSSLDFDIDVPPSTTSTPVFVPTSSTSPSALSLAQPSADQSTPSTQQDSTRHLARVASTNSVALQRSLDSLAAGQPASQTAQGTIDEQTMEDLFREILVPVPSGETVITEDSEEGVGKEENSSPLEEKNEPTTLNMDDDLAALSTDDHSVDWANEIEMQRLLDSLQQSAQQQHFAGQDFAMNSVVDLGLGLLSWNEVEGMNSNGVDVF